MTKAQSIILLIWLSSTVFAFYYFTKDRLKSFDPDNKLEHIEHKKLASHLMPLIDGIKSKGSHTILHFSKLNCECQKYSEQHIIDINKIAKDNHFNIENIVLDQDDVLPSTPSVAIIDDLGDVVYFGPYGQGLACSQTLGYAQTMLNNYLKGFTANIIIKSAKGCYCTI